MISKAKLILGGIGLVVAAVAVEVATFDAKQALADFDQVERGMARHYANLDTIAAARHLDLARLDRDTRASISGAKSRVQYYLALRSFVAAFGDPHLKVERGRHPNLAATDGSSTAEPAPESCKAAGYSDGSPEFAGRMFSLPRFRLLARNPFPAAIAGDIGVIRIASFDERQYVAECDWAFRPGNSTRALQLATRKELQKRMVETIAKLRKAGARRLLIDLTGNGGGSEWDREAAALFTTGTMRRAEARLADAPCDRSSLWQGKRPACAVFKPSADETATVQGRGQWRGPVAILADEGTASASEEFIGWLVDNKRAHLIGTRTMGAGCGYVDGGKPVVLKAAPLTLVMPNCARFTAAGANEIDGFTPTHALPFPARGDEARWGRDLAGAVGG